MPRLTRIYTRKGDAGTTRLATGTEVPKESPRVAAYGTVDELNAQIGAALSLGLCRRLAGWLPRVQNRLLDLGAELATPPRRGSRAASPRIEARHVEELERLIDELNEVLGPLESFVLPGGSPGAAALHVARTVCRRAEREVVALSRREPLSPHAVAYLNRLSDALFVMARYENRSRKVQEPLWQPGR